MSENRNGLEERTEITIVCVLSLKKAKTPREFSLEFSWTLNGNLRLLLPDILPGTYQNS